MFEAFTLIMFRVHYTIDIFTGLIMAHYCFYIAGFITGYVDKKIFKSRARKAPKKAIFNSKTEPLLDGNELIQRDRSQSHAA